MGGEEVRIIVYLSRRCGPAPQDGCGGSNPPRGAQPLAIWGPQLANMRVMSLEANSTPRPLSPTHPPSEGLQWLPGTTAQHPPTHTIPLPRHIILLSHVPRTHAPSGGPRWPG